MVMSQLSPRIARMSEPRIPTLIGALVLALSVVGVASHLPAETGSATEAMKGTSIRS